MRLLIAGSKVQVFQRAPISHFLALDTSNFSCRSALVHLDHTTFIELHGHYAMRYHGQPLLFCELRYNFRHFIADKAIDSRRNPEVWLFWTHNTSLKWT